MIDKINNNQIPDYITETSARQTVSARNVSSSDADASLQVDFASLIEKATQIPQDDATAVQKAQELLESGQLESPENIRAAAENIATFGV